MTTHDPGKPDFGEPGSGKPVDPEDVLYESRINALLEGELTPAEAEALKAAAREDSRLAEAIVAAWQLQESLDRLAIEKAPASLRQRLQRIPVEYGETRARSGFGLAGWALSLGVVAVAAVSLTLVLGPRDNGPVSPEQVAGHPEPGPVPDGSIPSAADAIPEDVAEARRELAIAFHYIDKAGLRTSREIRSVLNEELAAPVKDNLSRHLPYVPQGPKEKQA